MKIYAIAVGLAAAVALSGSVNASPLDVRANNEGLSIDYKCVFRIMYQLIGYLNTGTAIGSAAQCSKSNAGDGYVAGAFALTTKYGTALAAIDEYKKSPKYNKEFDAFIPTLEKYNQTMSGSTEGLDKFCDAWTTAAKNEDAFYNAQIVTVRNLYGEPTVQVARSLFIRFPLTRAAMTNAAIVGGLDNKDSGLGAIIAATSAGFSKSVNGTSGNNVKAGSYLVDEFLWLDAFLDKWDKLSKGGSTATTKVYRGLLKAGFHRFSDTIAFTGLDNKPVSFTCIKLY
ncbi:hypothetical protein H4R19_001106 [Coemansia spiralis]|nr:hypothetical protein H4R19_001106 [Coemansia spiralis]